jgi:hypothetical protein
LPFRRRSFHERELELNTPFALSLMELLAIRLSPQAGKSLVMSKGELIYVEGRTDGY